MSQVLKWCLHGSNKSPLIKSHLPRPMGYLQQLPEIYSPYGHMAFNSCRHFHGLFIWHLIAVDTSMGCSAIILRDVQCYSAIILRDVQCYSAIILRDVQCYIITIGMDLWVHEQMG